MPRMTPKALTALLGSIRKWEKIVLGTGKDRGSYNCPLCIKFRNYDCRGCPVKTATGQKNCEGTPYADYLLEEDIGEWRPVDADGLYHARRMLDFLRSLLPAKQKPDYRHFD
jgi:hypothetical protein